MKRINILVLYLMGILVVVGVGLVALWFAYEAGLLGGHTAKKGSGITRVINGRTIYTRLPRTMHSIEEQQWVFSECGHYEKFLRKEGHYGRFVISGASGWWGDSRVWLTFAGQLGNHASTIALVIPPKESKLGENIVFDGQQDSKWHSASVRLLARVSIPDEVRIQLQKHGVTSASAALVFYLKWQELSSELPLTAVRTRSSDSDGAEELILELLDIRVPEAGPTLEDVMKAGGRADSE